MTAVNYMPDYVIRSQDDLSVLPETYGDKLIVHLTLQPQNTAYWTLADALLSDIEGAEKGSGYQEESVSHQQQYEQSYLEQEEERERERQRSLKRGASAGHSVDRRDYRKDHQADMYKTQSPSFRAPVYSSTITISKCIKDGYDSDDGSPFPDFLNETRQKTSYTSRSADYLADQQQRLQQSRSPLDTYNYSEFEGSDISRESTLNRSGAPLSKASPANTLNRSREVSMSQLQLPSGPPLLITVQQEEQTSYESTRPESTSPALTRGSSRPVQSSSDPQYNTGRSTASRDLDDLMTSISEFDASVAPRGGGAGLDSDSLSRSGGAGGRGGGRGYDDVDSMPSLVMTTTTTGVTYPGAGGQLGGLNGGQGAGAGLTNGAGGVDGAGHPVPRTQVFNASQVTQVTRPRDGGEHAVHGKAGGQGMEGMLIRLDGDSSENGMLRIPKGDCAACSQPVSGQVLLALNNIYHPEHFTCAHCRQQLGTNIFYEHSGQAFCEHDYQMLFSPKCAGCNGAILEKCISALNQSWHPEHFLCAACGKQFGDEGFHEKDGLAYCSDDYFGMFAPKCGGCQGPILDNYISALHKQWHPDCFVCQECSSPFESGSFYDHEGLPYCENHFHARRGSLCAVCNKPIAGRCVAALYKKYHPEHFVCCFCQKPLSKATFRDQGEKPYCLPCFDKLFG